MKNKIFIDSYSSFRVEPHNIYFKIKEVGLQIIDIVWKIPPNNSKEGEL